MVSLFSSLNIASNALSVNESAISVVSHNVANMNTEGYSKQRVNLATRNIAGTIGDNVNAQVRSNGGVMIANVMRYNNDYLNNYYRTQVSELNKYQAQLDGLGDLADVFNDLDGEGIDGALGKFYDSLNNLQEYPASSTARINFIETAKSLAAVLNSKSVQLDQLNSKALGDGESTDALEKSEIFTKIGAFNDKLEELAEVNKALQVTQTGTLTANNLLDKRDLILNDIAEYIDIQVKENPNGSVTLYSGDDALVKGSVVTGKLSIEPTKTYCLNNGLTYTPEYWIDAAGNRRTEKAVVSIVNSSGNVVKGDTNGDITGGSLGGLLHSGDLNADGMNPGKAQAALNLIASEVADMFNTLNKRENAFYINPNDTSKLYYETDASGNITNGGNNADIFTTQTGTGTITAGNISVNPDLLTDDGCWKIACAYFRDSENFDENAIGNAQNVGNSFIDPSGNPIGSFLGTRSEKRANLNGQSLEDYYTGLVGKIAAGGSNAQNMVDTQQGIVDSLYNQIKSNNSVDLNEELVDLVKYQTAYAVSAQVFNVVNNCLDTLMTLGR